MCALSPATGLAIEAPSTVCVPVASRYETASVAGCVPCGVSRFGSGTTRGVPLVRQQWSHCSA
eukprot:5669263-Lingulodinium_polyedra.AAC.1